MLLKCHSGWVRKKMNCYFGFDNIEVGLQTYFMIHRSSLLNITHDCNGSFSVFFMCVI